MAFAYLFAALLGLAVGSFLNVVILRLPQGQSIAYPASHCPACKHPLKWWHNIPLLSWLLLGGKCAFCKTSISIQYPLIELVTALIFVLVAYKQGLTPYALATALSFTMLLALSIIDLRFKAVPDSINLLASLFAVFHSAAILQNLTAGLLFAGGFSMLRFVVSYYVSKKEELHLKKQLKLSPWLADFYPKYVMIEAMGEGDIMVAFTMGAILGVKLALVAVFIAALLALPASIAMRIAKNDKELPFIPFLAAGLFIAYLWSDSLGAIVDAYHL